MVTVDDVKRLREETGAGVMDAKRALDESGGDFAKAKELLRERGMAAAAKRADRSTGQGVVEAYIHGGGRIGALVEVNCETDFVAKGERFVALAEQVLAQAVATGATDADALVASTLPDGRTVQALLEEGNAATGERIVVRRVAQVSGEHVTAYLHRTNKDLPPQIGVLLATSGGDETVAHDVAMHIAAFSPTVLSREDVPADTVANERRLAEATAREEGKPETALPKIIEGRVNGFFKENVLLDQAFAKDQKKTVTQVLKEAGAQATAFARFRVGN